MFLSKLFKAKSPLTFGCTVGKRLIDGQDHRHQTDEKPLTEGPKIPENIPDWESGTGQKISKYLLENNKTIIFVFKPEAIKQVMMFDSKTPYSDRYFATSVLKYRLENCDVHSSDGLFTSNGEKWGHLRDQTFPVFKNPDIIASFIPDVEKVVDNFCNRYDKFEFSQEDDMYETFRRLFLEITYKVILGLDKEVFAPDQMDSNSETSILLSAISKVSKIISVLDQKDALTFNSENDQYVDLCAAHKLWDEVAVHTVQWHLNLLKSGKVKSKPSILELLLRNPKLSHRDVNGIICDSLMGGVDTMAAMLTFFLHKAVTHGEEKYRLVQEAKGLLGHDKFVTPEVLTRATFTAFIKETFRLCPTALGTGRILKENLNLVDFNFEKDTIVTTGHKEACASPSAFEEPTVFDPRRWCPGTNKRSWFRGSVYKPFGYNSRTCVAMNLARQNLKISLMKICSRLEFKSDVKTDMKLKLTTLYEPEKNEANFQIRRIN